MGTQPDPPTYSVCGNGGLSVCRYDVYVGNEGQWVDITGVPDSEYVLETEANDTHLITETDYTNNSAAVRVQINGNTVTVLGPA